MNQFIIPTNAPSGLKLYDPEKGLLALASAEAAHKHFSRAKNLDGLSKAIAAKLKEQRNFVLWWDRMGKKKRLRAVPKMSADLRHLCPSRDETACPTGASSILPSRTRAGSMTLPAAPLPFASPVAASPS